MANEPERPIETSLRAAAKQRRDAAGVPFQLHPVNRCRLQEEVAREFGQPQRQPRSLAEVIGQFWPRIAWGVGLLAVLGLSVWLLLPPLHQGEPAAKLAMNQPASEALAAKRSPPAPAAAPATLAPPPAPASEATSTELAFAEKAQAAGVNQARQLNAPQPRLAADTTVARGDHEAGAKVARSGSVQLAERQKKAETQLATARSSPAAAPADTAGGTYAARYGLAAKPPSLGGAQASVAAPPAVATKSPAPDLSPANESVTFVQVVPKAKGTGAVTDKPASPSPVLTSFQVQQVGSELRVVDRDGSVYAGYWQAGAIPPPAIPTSTEGLAVAPRSQTREQFVELKPARALQKDQLASQSYAFRVVGTNRSLNQLVVFTGRMLTATNSTWSMPVATNLNIVRGTDGTRPPLAQQGIMPLLNTRISGHVVVGSGKAAEVNALPAKP
jgi:hypothetical protein